MFYVLKTAQLVLLAVLVVMVAIAGGALALCVIVVCIGCCYLKRCAIVFVYVTLTSAYIIMHRVRKKDSTVFSA